MYKILLTSLLSAGALAAQAQGVLSFTDYGTSVSHVWSPNLSAPQGPQVTGNSSPAYLNGIGVPPQDYDNPAGSATYPSAVLLGGYADDSGPNGIYGNGNLWTVQLEALAGTVAVPLSTLLPVSQYTSVMNTDDSSLLGIFAGQFSAPVLGSDPGIPGTSATAYQADIAVACWYNGSGITTLAEAETTPGEIWGESPEVVGFQTLEPTSLDGFVANVGQSPPNVSTPSFGLVVNAPEPDMVAMGMMGLGTLIAVRRKN